MKIIKKMILYFLSATLLLSYLMCLFIGKSMNVSDEYKLFYVTKDLYYYADNGELKKYSTNTKYKFSDNNIYKNLGYGWSQEKSGIWMTDQESNIFFYITKKEDYNYKIELDTIARVGYSTKLYVNNGFVGTLKFDTNGNTTLSISNKLLKDGINKFSFRTSGVKPNNEVNVDSKDTRLLNILVDSIEVIEEN